MRAGAIFTAIWSALTMAGNAWYARAIARTGGRSAAWKTFAVFTASLAAYAAVCVWLGFGFAAQLLAVIVSAAVLLFCKRWIAVPEFVRFLLSKSREDRDV